MDSGISHMEWFRRPDGTLAISEVAARPPGAQFTSLLSYAHDFDFYKGWSDLLVHGRFEVPERKYSCGAVYLRGQGDGRVQGLEGLQAAQEELGDLVVEARLPRRGQPKASSYEGEGFVILRHPRHRGRRQRPQATARPGQGRIGLTMRVLMISPGFPLEMPAFTRGLAEAGAQVLGIGDQPLGAMAPEAREALHDYRQVRDLWDERTMVDEVRTWLRGTELDRVECLWEPGMMVAAAIREAFGLPGLTRDQTIAFRDKEIMKQRLDEAGVRVPRHASATDEVGIRDAAERIGYPLIVKPVAGAGSADTWPVRSDEELEEVIRLVRHVKELSIEEFVEGEEFTYDTVSANGSPLFENVAWYRPKPLYVRLNPWISQVTCCLRELEAPGIDAGVALGRQVSRALGIETGFSHMEWFLKPDGEAVFCEIGARSPGGRLVHVMNYSCDIDLFRGWGDAVVNGSISQDLSKKYNAAVVFKRARGEGIIQRIEGLDSLLARHGEHVSHVDLAQVGEPKRDWRKIVSGDGWIVVRHPNLEEAVGVADRFASELTLYAG